MITIPFEIDASLKGVDPITPIDVHNFNEIECEIISFSVGGFQIEWFFDYEETNAINQGLGLTDITYTDTDDPFLGSKLGTKVNFDPDNPRFFLVAHKYVLGIKASKGDDYKIIKWTLTMNSPPVNGVVQIIPSMGLRDTTTFIIRCENFEDENTNKNDITYNVYFIEDNTNSKVFLTQSFSSNVEVYSNFTVRYYQLDSTYLNIYCEAKDAMGDVATKAGRIKIVNKPNILEYNLNDMLVTFKIEDDLDDLQLLARTEFLKSAGLNALNEKRPESYFTLYTPSLTGEKVEKQDPNCINGYCNGHGTCGLIDISIVCSCNGGFIGTWCQVDKDGYTNLASMYKKVYDKLMTLLETGTVINDNIFNSFYNLFFSAQNFMQDDSFFTGNLMDFKEYLTDKDASLYIFQSQGRVDKLLDMSDFFFQYFYIMENQLKLTNKINKAYEFRNLTLEYTEALPYQSAFIFLIQNFNLDASAIIKNYKKSYEFKSTHFNFFLEKIDETFDEDDFFETKKTLEDEYKPKIKFMKCLRSKRGSFNLFLNYIEFLQNPLSYDQNFYPNLTSPFIQIKLYEPNGKEYVLQNCRDSNKIEVELPFKNYDFMDYINAQKFLFNPENYKLENDPIFKDPVYVMENGTVTDDVVQDRIDKYYRYFNISGLTYLGNEKNLFESQTLLFKNISAAFYLMFETQKLGAFSSMLIPNVMNFKTDGRFFYVLKPEILKDPKNYFSNIGFWLIFILFFLFVVISLISHCLDYQYYADCEQLDFLKKEIIKVHFPYKQIEPGVNDENILNIIPEKNINADVNKRYEIKHMFDGVNFGEGEEEEEESDDDKENEKEIPNLPSETSSSSSGIDDKKNDNNKVENGKRNMDSDNINLDKHVEREEDKSIRMEKDAANPPRKALGDSNTFETEKNNIATNGNLEDGEKNGKNPERVVRYKREPSESHGYGSSNSSDFDLNKRKSDQKYKKNNPIQVNNYFRDVDKTKPNLISIQKFHNQQNENEIDGLPLDIINEDKEKTKALEAYAKLTLTPKHFFYWNLKHRHILTAPFNAATLFNKRWKKLMVLLLQFNIYMLFLSVLLTNDEKYSVSNFFSLFAIAIAITLVSNFMMYFFIIFFKSSTYQRTKLFRIVMDGGDLIVLKAFEEMMAVNDCSAVFGVILFCIFFIANFYITVTFTSVWKKQRGDFIVGFIFCLFDDLVVGEIGIELIIMVFYMFRKDYNCMRNFGECLNRVRSFRAIWP